ncbi:acyl-ACP desaturase [Acidithrix ferrooxidans]|uniref:Putative acyl-[acyl-carrier-protein] desaturase DesA1 n=1 Tax=Acidithrix ferrooxidans TaxID=1280514 RepID=A0A0D8HCZ8_9ACTN|nr:acyl-ACP desaturase [Acidithrix ferrooxidans]KJF15818.1 putative acyl-[acyl-carrier-protein] desaturase DesA1 [Acidithrix ferrooxidans]
MNFEGFLKELEPTVGSLMTKHLGMSKEWFPHELVPWSRGRDFVAGEEWDSSSSTISPGTRSALFVNLLTEDNLPYYFNALLAAFGSDDSWGAWARRWTAEEHRHSIVIRDYLTVTRLIDPITLERSRMNQVSNGIVPEPVSPVDTIAYVTLQELATRVAHRNTGKLIGDEVGFAIMARVASDENLHHLFYRDLTLAALERNPSETLEAIERQVRSFSMPGTGIDGFTEHSKNIAKEGIYDFSLHYDQVIVPVVLRNWRICELSGLTPEADAARERLMKFIARLEVAARRTRARRDDIEGAAQSNMDRS